MRKALMGAILLLFTSMLTCSQPTKHTEEIQLLVPPVPAQYTNFEEINKPINITHNTIENNKLEKDKNHKEKMINDITSVWEMFFDDDNAPNTDPRRQMFLVYANAIADAIIYYQNNEADIGGMMPKHRSAQIVTAIWVARESSVRMDVVGKKYGEVCLFQLHGKALNGFAPEVVKNNIELCSLLGVRWIAHSTSQCENNRKPTSNKWNDLDWLRPMTIYGSGPRKTYKDPIGKRQCKIFSFARRRVADISMYKSRIDIEEKQDLLSY